MNQTKNRDFSNRTFARLTFKFTDWLKYTASFQYEYAEYKTEQLKSKDSYEVRNKVNTFSTSNNDGTSTFALPYGNIFSLLPIQHMHIISVSSWISIKHLRMYMM